MTHSATPTHGTAASNYSTYGNNQPIKKILYYLAITDVGQRAMSLCQRRTTNPNPRPRTRSERPISDIGHYSPSNSTSSTSCIGDLPTRLSGSPTPSPPQQTSPSLPPSPNPPTLLRILIQLIPHKNKRQRPPLRCSPSRVLSSR
jgi:hypothetical protein